MKKRVPYIDCIRVFACFLVVAVHCNYMPSNPTDHIWAQILGVIGSPSSELFLTISGALLIPVKEPTKVFLKKRFYKLLPPFFIWSIFGILFLIVTRQQELSKAWILLCSIPFNNNVIGVYWFMYTIMGLYLLAPVLSPFIEQKKQGGGILLILWMLTILLPLLNLIIPGLNIDNSNPKSMLNSFYGYAGYMVLGWYLKSYPFKFTQKKYGWIVSLSFLIISIMIISIVGIFFPEYRGYVCDNLSFVNMLYVVSLFTLIQSVFKRENRITWLAHNLTKYTFGVYLVHVFVIYIIYILIEKESYPVVLQLPVTIFLSFASSVFVVWLFTSIKPLRWTVQGYKYSPDFNVIKK